MINNSFPLQNLNLINDLFYKMPGFGDDFVNANIEQVTTYGYPVKCNEYNFRSPKFEKNIDLLFAGCSFTFGVGLPFNVTWGASLAKENNLSYNSIAMPGGSCMSIIFNIFKYFEKFGNPKTLLALFPDFSRVHTYLDGNILAKNNKKEVFCFVDDQYPKNHRKLKYLQLPTEPKNVYSEEFCYMLNSMYIKMLEVYCNNNNIKFIWFKWTEDTFDNINLSGFSNYYAIDHQKDMRCADIKSSSSIHNECHLLEKSMTGEPDYLWHMAKDAAHFGIHWHIHIKELFQKALKEI